MTGNSRNTVATGPVSQTKASPKTASNRQMMLDLFKASPIPPDELMVNLGLFMRSGALARILFLNEVYQQITHIPGIVCEFGVWWGQSLAVFENLRAAYEPYNHTRKIVGFDTFQGYVGIGKNDKGSNIISEGVYKTPDGYEHFLDKLLTCHEDENVMSHIRKHELVKGDATKTAAKYFGEDHREQLVALAFFDMALYEPTKACLEAIKAKLVKGSIVAFDELNNAEYPGETIAATEVLGLTEFEVRRSRFLPDRAYFVKL
jgi:hypothetical protein